MDGIKLTMNYGAQGQFEVEFRLNGNVLERRSDITDLEWQECEWDRSNAVVLRAVRTLLDRYTKAATG